MGNTIQKTDELLHFGIPGQKWYQRRFQNRDGSLTPAGRIRYAEAYKRYQAIRVRSMVGNFVKQQYAADPKCNEALKAWQSTKRRYDRAEYAGEMDQKELDELYYEKERLYEEYSKEKRRVYNTQIKDSYEYKLLNNQYNVIDLIANNSDVTLDQIEAIFDSGTVREILDTYGDRLSYEQFIDLQKYRKSQNGKEE